MAARLPLRLPPAVADILLFRYTPLYTSTDSGAVVPLTTMRTKKHRRMYWQVDAVVKQDV